MTNKDVGRRFDRMTYGIEHLYAKLPFSLLLLLELCLVYQNDIVSSNLTFSDYDASSTAL